MVGNALIDRYARVNGYEVRYQRAGQGPLVIFVHGIGASLEFWTPNLRGLAGQFQVCALDLPGFGRSAVPPVTPTLADVPAFFDAFLDHLGAERAAFVGNSMGGLVVLTYALARPERVSHLGLVASAGLGRDLQLDLRLLALPLLPEILFRPTPGFARRAIRALFCQPSADTEALAMTWLEHIRRPGARQHFLRIARQGIGLRGQKPGVILLDRLPQVQPPTLLIWGDRDPVIPVAHAYAAARLIPRCALVVFPACGHCPQLERAAAFNALLGRFLSAPEAVLAAYRPVERRATAPDGAGGV